MQTVIWSTRHAVRSLLAIGLFLAGQAVWATGNPPTVAITKPVDGAKYPPSTVITLVAQAADTDGQVVKVEYVFGPVTLGSATNAPYEVTLPPLPIGRYGFSAIATDNEGLQTVSEPVFINIEPPTEISIFSPESNATYEAPGQINFFADITTPTNVTVQKVDFFIATKFSTNQLGTATAFPYAIQLTNIASGTYSFTAVVVDNRGFVASATTTNVMVVGGPATNIPPAVAITTPTNNTVVKLGQNVTLTATAGDADGTVTNLTLYRLTSTGGVFSYTVLGSGSSNTLSVTLTNPPSQEYLLTTRATDNQGGTTLSEIVRVVVYQPGVMTGTSRTTNGTVLVNFTGSFGVPEGTSDFMTWTQLQAEVSQGGVTWFDTAATNAPMRFYRFRHNFAP